MLDLNQYKISSMTNQMLDLAPWPFQCVSPNSEMDLSMVFESDCEPGHHHRELDEPDKYWKFIVAL
jgi:hypothetical protein